MNKNTYEALAHEYEERVASLLPVTEESMTYFCKYLKSGDSILDIGCAVGIAISVLRRKGFKADGIEISPKMVQYAKSRNPQANIILSDFLTADITRKYDAILTFAFIHLFPKKNVIDILSKIGSILVPDGVALISSTESLVSKEGWEIKDDFNRKEKRFRKFWKEEELAETIIASGFTILELKKFKDPLGKVWMDFVVRKT